MTAATSKNGFYDAYGNVYHLNISASTIASTVSPDLGLYNQGGVINYPYTVVPAGTSYTFYCPPSVTPNAQLLSDPANVDKLISKMITLYKPGDPLVVCVDNEFTPQQVRELGELLKVNNINGVLITGARAGTGRPVFRPVKPEHERVDILARIGEVWERRPDLSLTDLLAWWHGEDMNDDSFAAAVDVYFNKIYED